MRIKNYLLTTGLSLGLFSLSVHAQTTSTFDDLQLPGADTNFAQMQPVGDYSFRSGNVTFFGNLASWGGYSGFNYSNVQNDTGFNFMNDKAAITGIGFDSSANYGTCFVSLDFMGPNPTATIPVGAKLMDSAAGHPVWGMYVTNTTYAYGYMQQFFGAGNWFDLKVKGYLAGTQVADSVVFRLADYTDTNTSILNHWGWVDLSSLGDVDSLTFDLSSNDTVGGFGMNNPAYFALDNLITSDGVDTTGGNEPPTGILQPQPANLSFTVSPNPVQSVLNLSVDHPVDVLVFDLSGRRILMMRKTTRVDVSLLAPGNYIIQVWDNAIQKMGSVKFVKQ